jgi:hypothetical protein
MRKILRTGCVLVILFRSAVLGQEAEKVYKVSGWGGHPISDELMSLWLAAPGGEPLIMVYFHGPKDWHKTKWNSDSKFAKGLPGWAALTSEDAKLRVWLDRDSGQGEVQWEKVNVHDANVYLVLNVADPKNQRVVPLGVFELPKSTDEPASVSLLRANPKLIEKMTKAIAGGAGA